MWGRAHFGTLFVGGGKDLCNGAGYVIILVEDLYCAELASLKALLFAAGKTRRIPMFQERIAQQYARLGRNQKRIADFLTQEYREAAFMNGSALSQRLDVDPATVTRFAQRLGYTGYPDLQREVQELVKEELKAAYG
jgi:DNA-binding MarR family transcriptional regulator